MVKKHLITDTAILIQSVYKCILLNCIYHQHLFTLASFKSLLLAFNK